MAGARNRTQSTGPPSLQDGGSFVVLAVLHDVLVRSADLQLRDFSPPLLLD